MKQARGNLKQRTQTGFILVLIISFLVSGNIFSFILLVLLINLLSLLEFYRLFYSLKIFPQILTGISISIYMITGLVLILSRICDWKILLTIVPFSMLIFIFELYRKKEYPFTNIAFTFLGFISITVPLCFFTAVAFYPFFNGGYNPETVLGYFIILWVHDTTAYFIGKRFGSHALFKRISPGKTWEGSIGGAAGAVTASVVLAVYFTMFSVSQWLSIALIIVVSGTFGDLIKSLMKRSLNIKDSGSILPGHGGMLDRFDSLFGSAPIVFCYLILLKAYV